MADSALRLSSRALIAIGGPDWRSFLQGLLTQDVESLAQGQARFGGLLTPQGKLLHDLFIVGREDGCWLDVAAEHRDAIIQKLSIYRLRAKVEIAADDAPVAATFAQPAGEGWVRDPRLPALGWRGYGVEADGDEAGYDARRLALGVPGPATGASARAIPSRPTSTSWAA
jgi:folate-binding Fe-S cluster repair protein YgfZ